MKTSTGLKLVFLLASGLITIGLVAVLFQELNAKPGEGKINVNINTPGLATEHVGTTTSTIPKSEQCIWLAGSGWRLGGVASGESCSASAS